MHEGASAQLSSLSSKQIPTLPGPPQPHASDSMPTTLPDPVLALSMDNVLKMNDLNLDQLANLWNVFTKCAESLESGRRLENLSWRLWFREAHILPADTSLSDLTDFTPLDTPLISRANSITGSYRPVRLSSSTVARSVDALSDPEDGNDSEYSTDSDSCVASTSTAPAPSAPASTPVKRRVRLDRSSRPSTPSSSGTVTVGASTSSSVSARAATQSQRIADTIAERTSRAMTAASRRANLTDVDADAVRRRRGISSSSAFGSKARVKQRNQDGSSRRRPLSFQAALESLVLTGRADNFASLRGKQVSMPQLDAHMNASTGALDAPRRRLCGNGDDAEHNSAPAELSPIQSVSVSHGAFASNLRSALEPTASAPTQELPAPVVEEHCDAPETRGPASPTKIPVALAPTIGAISRRGSQTMLSDGVNAERKNAVAIAAPREGRNDHVSPPAALKQAMPPPQGLPEPTPAASAIKLKAQSEQQIASAKLDEQASDYHRQPPAHASIGMVRSDSASSASTQASHRSSVGGAATRRTSEARIRTKGSGAGLHAGHRTKSSSGLLRAAKHSKSSDKIGGAPARPASRHNLLSGLAMTRAAPEAAPAQTVTRKPVPTQPDAPKASAAAAAAKKAPVKFTMGGDETDSEDYEDTSSDDDDTTAKALALPAQRAAESAPAKAAAANDSSELVAEDDADDDDWASDSEAEEQECRARQAAEAERRKRDEEERHKSMFQKQAIRSKSAADLRLLAPTEPISAGPSAPEQPVRGLLSSLFHPDEQHSPPGQLAGRPHASAADLRAKPSLSSQLSPSQPARSPPTVRRQRVHRDSNDSTSQAPRSFREGGFAGLTGIKTSKSAVALPLLDTHITRSSTAGKAKQEGQAAAGSHHSDGSASSPDSPVAAASSFRRPGSLALARLQAITHMKVHAKRSSTSSAASDHRGQEALQPRRNMSEANVQLDREASSRSLRLEVSPDDRDFAVPSRASLVNLAQSQPRQSAPSLASRHSDQQPSTSGQQRDVLGSGSRSNSEGLPSGHSSMQRNGVSMNGPVSISRPRSSLNLPEAAAPQTPRTTRRNMLRDELSESLRQNLLWERQSRSRMMGLGAPMAPINQPQPAPSSHRRDNVLNGNALRPLTSTGPSGAEQRDSEAAPKPKRYSEEWGSFHHKGW